MSIFWVWVIVGILAGLVAKRVMRDGPRGTIGDLVVGVIGALVGGWILNLVVHAAGTGFSTGSVLIGLVGAAVFLWGLRRLGGRSMQPETAAKLKFGAWALAGGAVMATIIGFAWGGWTTTSAAQTKTDAAVLATRAAICVAQFMSQPDHQAKLKALKETSSWDRAAVVEKGGWDRMPGEKDANATVSRACAEGLEVLIPR
jgi:uncharacterized membrane protein YeaQ/YmgE (transglycosylase-associated protein family)